MRCIDWNGYKIREDGEIFNKDGTVKSKKVNKKGYFFSNFWYDGKAHCHLFHTVIAWAFLGPTPEGFEADHQDNNRQNNQVSNLQYLSKSDNNKKSYTSGNRNINGERNPNSKARKAAKSDPLKN